MKEPVFLQSNDGMTSGSDRDKFLDEILKTDMMKPLPEDFADRVAVKAVKRMAMRQSLTELLTYAGMTVSVILVLFTVIYLLRRETWEKWTDFLVPNMNILTGIALILLFILFMDRMLLPRLFFIKKEKENIAG
jgi:hypothetical protein